MKRLAIAVLAVAFLFSLPQQSLAHPMGNFSINHYSKIRVGVDKIAVHYILDFAEIPTYQLDGLHTDEWVANLGLTLDGRNEPLLLQRVDSQKLPGATDCQRYVLFSTWRRVGVSRKAGWSMSIVTIQIVLVGRKSLSSPISRWIFPRGIRLRTTSAPDS